MKKRIIISGGGTLGHILPIIPVVKEIYKEYDLYFVGTKKGLEKKYIESNDLLKYFKK
jgi:UDP-N-acetylglucosamine--N-acetylmuramyl-(pentapeptide) pyrophosphoryl-undecaprenol N-acetylglucosamine transferase